MSGEKKQSEIKFNVTLDSHNIPEKITWSASDNDAPAEECRSIMLSLWDHQEQNTLRIDLWTKDMRVDEMDNHFLQSMVLMAESYQRATQNPFVVEEIKTFAAALAKKISKFEQDRQQKGN